MKRFLGWCHDCGWLRENAVASIKGVGKLRPRGKSLGKSGNELRVKQARLWYVKALELATAGDEGATAGLVALLLGMRAGEIVGRKVGDVDEDQSPGDLPLGCDSIPLKTASCSSEHGAIPGGNLRSLGPKTAKPPGALAFRYGIPISKGRTVPARYSRASIQIASVLPLGRGM